MNPNLRLRMGMLGLVPALLAACATPPPPGIQGRWRPVNRFDAAPQAIPLHVEYAYYASPLDRTLKGMLERWARDRHMTLEYRHEADFTLFGPVAQLRTTDLAAAVAQLQAIYAPQHVAIAVQGERIVVTRGEPEAAR